MKKLKLTFILLILLGFISSCDDFLSEVPDNRTLLNTPEKISEILVNAYPTASYMEFTETRTDNAYDSENLPATTLNNSQNFKWEDLTDVSRDTPAFYWDACYTAIAHANQAIDAIQKLGDPANLNPQKGEALLARAYSHFMLVSIFSQRYNPATASTDLGIPYVLEPETVLLKKYTRNTVAEVFINIENDIEQGLKLVGDNYTQPKFHFNKAAAKAFASRFYLIKGNWDKVLENSNDLSSQPVDMFRDYTKISLLGAQEQFTTFSRASENSVLLVSSTSSVYSRTFKRNRFGVAGAYRSTIYGSGTNLFNKSWIYPAFSANGSITAYFGKFIEYFKYTNANAGIGLPYVTNVLLNNEELFLNKIEAHIMKNDFVSANTEMEYFLSTRTEGYSPITDKVTEAKVVAKYPVIVDEYTPFYSLTPTQASYIKAVAELRRIEFLHEGLRWFDIKRFNLQVKHNTYNEPVNILEKNDKRRAIQIPLYVTNTGVEKNPR